MRHELPAHCTTRYVVRVRFGDTDLMGIVHHANYLNYFEAGRVEYMHRRGIDYLEWTQRGVHLPVVEAQLRYRKAARFDERLVIESRLAELGKVRVRFNYRLLREHDEALVADGTTLLACTGADHILRPLPADVIEQLLSPESRPRPIDQA